MSVQDLNEYEDLLGEWADLESGLGMILLHPDNAQQFASRVVQYDRWMQSLIERDADVGLYLLFQLAVNSPVGYSASHALVCAVLCHLMAGELALPPKERDSLVRAAMTMNIGMTALQDTLATQDEKPTPEQQEVIRTHPLKGAMLLTNLGIGNDDWLEIISSHHDDSLDRTDTPLVTPVIRLTRILRAVDRYAAMISPRQSRAGRSATDSARTILAKTDDIGKALVQIVGLTPPGTFVHMDSDELGLVVRRTSKANMPYVVIIGSAEGEVLRKPRLHNTAQKYPRIHSALPASGLRLRLNHHHILQLGAMAAIGI